MLARAERVGGNAMAQWTGLPRGVQARHPGYLVAYSLRTRACRVTRSCESPRMTKALVSALAFVFVVAGCSSGAQEAGPVPSVPSSPGQTSTPTTTEPAPSTSTNASTPICADKTAAVKVDSEQGAAGTIRTVWKVRNTAPHPCRTFGYPGMDFHSAGAGLTSKSTAAGSPISIRRLHESWSTLATPCTS
jgi:hypothetical protein